MVAARSAEPPGAPGAPPAPEAFAALLGLMVDGRTRSVNELARALRIGRPTIAEALRMLVQCGLVRHSGTYRYPRFVFAAERYAVAWAFLEDSVVTVELAALDRSTVAVRSAPRERGRERAQVQRLVAESAAARGREVLATVIASNERLDGAGASGDEDSVQVERVVHLAAYGESRRVYPDEEMVYFAYRAQGRVERGVVIAGSIVRGAGGIAGLIDETGPADAGRRLGEMIGEDLRLLNPSVVVLSSDDGDPSGEVLAAVRHAVYAGADPALTGSLVIEWSRLGLQAPGAGAKELALASALSPAGLARLLASAGLR